MIKIEFPANRTDIALAMSKALAGISGAKVTQHAGPARVLTQHAGPARVLTQLAEGYNAEEQEELAAAGAHLPLAELEEEVGSTLSDWVSPEATAGTAAPTLDEAAVADLTDVRRDEKGVPFNAEMCANAAKPFYASGKEKGQWKRRPGVDQVAYDAWYSDDLDNVPTATMAPEPELDIGAAFIPAALEAPTNAGDFFGWISEMQTAGRLTQADLDAAYPAAGVNPTEIWGQTLEVQGQMFAAVHAILVQKAAV